MLEENKDSEPSGEFFELSELLRNTSSKLELTELSVEEKQKALAQNAVLTGVDVTFYTRNDDKDGDTWLETWINMAGEREAAYGQTYGHFNDWSYFLLQLRPKSNVMQKSNIGGSWLQVRIKPNGNDTWVFTCKCTLFFSDGTFFDAVFNNPTTLSQDSRQANFYL